MIKSNAYVFTAIKWFFYRDVNNNAYKHRKQSEELVPQLWNTKQLVYFSTSKVVTTTVLKHHAEVPYSIYV